MLLTILIVFMVAARFTSEASLFIDLALCGLAAGLDATAI